MPRAKAHTRYKRPPLTIDEVLRWADQHHARTGRWPTVNSGRVTGVPSENWSAINFALREGYRGLPGGLSLAQFLAKHRGKSRRYHKPLLTHDLILRWADDHRRRSGR